MSEDTVRMDVEVPRSVFNEIAQFVDEHKNTRRDSNRFYGRAACYLAREFVRQQDIELHELREEHRNKQADLSDVIKEAVA